MNHFKNFLTAAAALVFFSCGCSSDLNRDCASVKIYRKDGVIKTEAPQRLPGQSSMLSYASAPLDTVRVGFVGLGGRGSSAVRRYVSVPWTKIVALCDVEPDRVQKNVDMLASKDIVCEATYDGEEGYKQMCERDDIDLVYICTDWLSHTPIALYAMEHGKHVAIEVPAATSLEECWALVDAAERNRLHCMMLENCCYDFFELSSLEMAKKDVLGEIVHAEGSYHHTLYVGWPYYWRNWRLEYNRTHKGDIYPTHGLGPICQALNIHRGDRMKTIVAMDTKSINGIKALKRDYDIDDPDFQNGDETSTMIRTEMGKTMLLEHDVMTYRPYDRMYQLVGTDGYLAKYPVAVYALSREKMDSLGIDYSERYNHGPLDDEQADTLCAKFPAPILDEELEELAKTVGGHGGMDFLMDYRLVYCLHYGLPLDMDVYDLAEWCSISELSAISISNSFAPVEVPDFTRGDWNKLDGFKYAFSDGSFK